MFKKKTLLSTATCNGENALVRRRSDNPHLASSKIASLQEQSAIAMTEKHPLLTPARLESTRFASSRFVGENLASGRDRKLALTLAMTTILRKHDHLDSPCFLFLFAPQPGLRP